MDTAFIVTAFVLGFFVKQIGLPPLVGFLAGGFVLNALGYTASELLYQLSDIGIILLSVQYRLKGADQKIAPAASVGNCFPAYGHYGGGVWGSCLRFEPCRVFLF